MRERSAIPRAISRSSFENWQSFEASDWAAEKICLVEIKENAVVCVFVYSLCNNV